MRRRAELASDETGGDLAGIGEPGDNRRRRPSPPGVKKKTPNLLGDKQPITTSLPDARWGDSSKDGFTPREPERSLMTLQRTPNGGFVLQPGYYMFVDQSYCLKAGTHGPGGGDGYLYAPPKGPAEDAVMAESGPVLSLRTVPGGAA